MPPICLYLLIRLTDFVDIFSVSNNDFGDFNVLFQIHGSVNGRNFKSKLRAEHVELLQSPWLIELGAFYLNSNGSDDGGLKQFSSNFSCDFNANPPVMKLMLPHLIRLEFDLTCAICLVRSYFRSYCKENKILDFVCGFSCLFHYTSTGYCF